MTKQVLKHKPRDVAVCKVSAGICTMCDLMTSYLMFIRTAWNMYLLPSCIFCVCVLKTNKQKTCWLLSMFVYPPVHFYSDLVIDDLFGLFGMLLINKLYIFNREKGGLSSHHNKIAYSVFPLNKQQLVIFTKLEDIW